MYSSKAPSFLEGKIHSSTWEDKETVKRYSWEVNGDNFDFIDGKRKYVKEICKNGFFDTTLIRQL